jgi:hypothetical protein
VAFLVERTGSSSRIQQDSHLHQTAQKHSKAITRTSPYTDAYQVLFIPLHRNVKQRLAVPIHRVSQRGLLVQHALQLQN